ncbi:MAG: hypothetical protein IKT68_05570 [Clostridia bacterium]|nr:hypothetical protein [Clostridia bacterium]
MAENKEFLTYKGHPLVRCGDTLYYGSMADKYVVMMKILSTKKIKDLDVAEKVMIQLMYTDDEMRAKDRIVKTSEKEGLYNAMDLGAIWLERALRD